MFPAAALAEGYLLAGRYRIVRHLAQGGMGEVYEARDQDLRESVALKLVRPDLAADWSVMERFRREIQLARRVTHPNVCRIFDLGQHRDADTGRSITFLTMELLRGETLQQRLRRVQRLSEAEALPLVLQMASALQAAHQAGVVHRDFKTSNVLLVPGAPGARAVVTDFGLARRQRTESDDESSTSTSGLVVGTAAYMAPEQARGEPATPSSDVYALGVVMFEMVTGARPHTGESPVALLSRRLNEDPLSPRLFAPRLDPRWETAILRCLERQPEKRFASAADLAAALSEGDAPQQVTAEQPQHARRRRLRRRAIATGLAGLLLAGAAALLMRVAGRPGAEGPRPAAEALRPRKTVAVLGFRNLSGKPESEWIGTAIAELVSAGLADGGQVRLIPSVTVARARAELELARAERFSGETLGRLRRNLGTDLVLVGAYLALGEEAAHALRVDLHLQDTATGETLVTVSRSGGEERIADLVAGAEVTLREALGLAPGQVTAAGRAALPASPEAARLYASALARIHAHDLEGARVLLEPCVANAPAADPATALAQAALSDALAGLGWEARAREAARRAVDLSSGLPQELRLALEAKGLERDGAPDRAAERYAALVGLRPDELEHGLALVGARLAARRAREAGAAVAAMRALPLPLSEDPRIDLAESRVAEALGDASGALEAASRASRKARERGASLLAAEADVLAGRALLARGEPEKALDLLAAARDTLLRAGDLAGAAEALRWLNRAGPMPQELPRARERSLEALAFARARENRAVEALALAELARCDALEGNLEGARRGHQSALALARETGNRRVQASSLDALGALRATLGAMRQAREGLEEARAIWRELREGTAAAATLVALAGLALEAAEPETARRLVEEASALARQEGGRTEALVRAALGRLDHAAAAFEGARRNLESAASGLDAAPAALARLHLAEVLLDGGHAAEALELADRQVEPLLAAGAFQPAVGEAYELAARALLALARPAEARTRLASAAEIASRTRAVPLRVAAAVTAARLAAEEGQAARARASLKQAAEEARRAGLTCLRLEAELALGRLELREGDGARLGRVREEASRRGLTLLARKAQAAGG